MSFKGDVSSSVTVLFQAVSWKTAELIKRSSIIIISQFISLMYFLHCTVSG